MSTLTLLLFFVYCYGLGFTVSSFVKNSENFLERNLMRFGFGLAILPFLGLILNLIRIPIDWRLILILSIAYPIYYLAKYRPKPKFQFKITKTNISILAMLVLFAINLYIYASGAFAYPYLEDDDSWSHATSIKFVSIEKTVFAGIGNPFHYIDPYPPSYDLLLGVLHQTNDSVYWTMKFFNALVISLSTIFFYFFVKEFTSSRNKALFAAFALLSIPAFMSHFIWAISLAVPLYFVVFYAVERIRYDKKWWILASLVMVTVLTSSPTHSTYFGLFFVLYLLTKMILERKVLFYHALAGLGGVLLSFVLWWMPMIVKYGFFATLKGLGIQVGTGVSALSVGGTADRVYTFKDFFIAQEQNMINNPIGIGVFLSILTAVALIFLFVRFKDLLKKENHWLGITLAWFVFTLYAVNAVNMPLKISPFRAWMLLAIPVCILAAEGAFNLMSISKKSMGNIGMYGILLILLTGIYFTSTQQKIAVNTAIWPPGAFWTSNEEIQGYLWLKENLPPNTKVFTFVNNGPVIGMDMYTCHWCDDVRAFQKTGVNESASNINSFLKSKDYKYLIIDGQFAKKYGVNETNNKLKDIATSGLFKPVHQTNGFFLFELL